MFVDDQEIGIGAIKGLKYPISLLVGAGEIATGCTEEAEVDIEAFACTHYFLCRALCCLLSNAGLHLVVQKTEWVVIKLGLVCLLHTQGSHPIAICFRSRDVLPRVQIRAVLPVEWDVDGAWSIGVVFHRLDYLDRHLIWTK